MTMTLGENASLSFSHNDGETWGKPMLISDIEVRVNAPEDDGDEIAFSFPFDQEIVIEVQPLKTKENLIMFRLFFELDGRWN